MKSTKLFAALLARIEPSNYLEPAPKQVKIKNTTPRKQAHAGYAHVSTKVVKYKDNAGVEHEGIIGITFKKPV